LYFSIFVVGKSPFIPLLQRGKYYWNSVAKGESHGIDVHYRQGKHFGIDELLDHRVAYHGIEYTPIIRGNIMELMFPAIMVNILELMRSLLL